MTSWWPFPRPQNSSSHSEKYEGEDEGSLTDADSANIHNSENSLMGVDQNFNQIRATPALETDLSQFNKNARPPADPELAISPKSIQMLEEAELRAFHRARRRKVLIATMVAIIVLVTLLIAVLFPRETYFNVEEFDINASNSTFREGDQLMTNWISQVAVDNKNFYAINIHEMKLTAYLEHDRRAPIGKGHAKSLHFPARAHSVNRIDFQMPVYAPSLGKPSLIAECMVNEKVELYIAAELDLSWTHWTGHWLPLDFFAVVDCKLPAVMQVLQRTND